MQTELFINQYSSQFAWNIHQQILDEIYNILREGTYDFVSTSSVIFFFIKRREKIIVNG